MNDENKKSEPNSTVNPKDQKPAEQVEQERKDRDAKLKKRLDDLRKNDPFVYPTF